jgi:hypothetical protein
MKLVKSLEKIEEVTKETQAASSADWIRYLKVRDGEFALIRFITDAKDVISVPMHNVTQMTPKGERTVKEYCTLSDNGACQNCAKGSAPSETIFLWVYVYYILHRTQNPRLEMFPDQKWQPVKVGATNMYKEDINKPMILRTGVGKSNYIKNLFLDFAREYDTLVDRDYKWSRKGAGFNDTTYNLIAKDKSDTNSEIVSITETLPAMEDVIMGKVKTFGEVEKVTEISADDIAADIEELF